MNKSFKAFGSRRDSKKSLEENEENLPAITKKKKVLLHGKLLIHIKEAKGS